MTEQNRRVGEVLAEQTAFNADWGLNDVKEDFTLVAVEFPPVIKWECVVLVCERDGEEHRWVTFSKVIIDQARRLEDLLPLTGRVSEENSPMGRYFSLV